MKDRLEKFIKQENLTPSRFAEIMGVQPSSISHILGGRNKPSYDFLEKMLLRFPKINPDWLLLGRGPIYRTSESTERKTTTEPSALFSEPSNMESFSTTPPTPQVTTPERVETSIPNIKTVASERSAEDPEQAMLFNETLERKTESSVPTDRLLSTLSSLTDREIEHVLILFKDKTFISYRSK